MILDFVFKIKKFIYTPKGTVQSRICKTFGGLGIIMLERAYLWLHGRSKKNDKVLLGFAEKPLNSTGLVDKHIMLKRAYLWLHGRREYNDVSIHFISISFFVS